MAGVSVVGYIPGTSILHRLDPRTKQFLVMFLGIVCFLANQWYFTIVTICILIFSPKSVWPFRLIGELKFFLLFLCVLFLVRGFGLDAHYIPYTDAERLQQAFLFCWQLLLVVLLGVMLVYTTSTKDIRAGLVWWLKPIPFINEQVLATMIGLLIRLIPLILFQALEISDGMKARNIENRRYPFYRFVRFTIQLFRRAFVTGDDLVDAMQARCYTEKRTMPLLTFAALDVLAALLGIGIALISLVGS
ncbi:MAG: energy-coupling factor transporter transmembrane protein EcfT [Desulfobulbaceae bacterium]|nr:MAG: energy-coupling factor transporter transmembrane protein EcfT [Desulfobulbaceae bacterium]